ncbi:MAG: flavin reductase [Lachnoclostridium sp.]|nr:flavin reductase [Lachnoclostridium sp.]
MVLLKEITAEEFPCSPFPLIGNEWMLISAEKDNKVNSMTASWGGLGVMWNKNVAYIVIRNSRFTKQFVDASEMFSLTFFDHDKYLKMYQYMGSVSGRDEDKIVTSGLTLSYNEKVPYFTEASLVMICRKLCCQPISPDSFSVDSIQTSFYEDRDYHNLYIGEIVKFLSV